MDGTALQYNFIYKIRKLNFTCRPELADTFSRTVISSVFLLRALLQTVQDHKNFRLGVISSKNYHVEIKPGEILLIENNHS